MDAQNHRKRVAGWAARSAAQALQEAGRHSGRERIAKTVFQSRSGASAGRRTDRTSGLREARPSRLRQRECRNGTSEKTLKGKNGEVTIDVPRDRKGTFEPQIVKKHQRRFDGFDDKILSMYARGITTRDIQGHLEEIYGVEVSPTLISNVTDAVVEEVKSWQS